MTVQETTTAPARLCALDSRLLCAFWDEQTATPIRPSAFHYAGKPIASPYARLDIPLPDGKGQRRLVIFRGTLHDNAPFDAMADGDGLLASGTVVTTLPFLGESMDAAGKERLLRFILDTARNLFRASGEDYAQSCLRLLRTTFASIPAAAAVLSCGELPTLAIIPHRNNLGKIQKAYILHDAGLAPLSTPPIALDAQSWLIQLDDAALCDAPEAHLVLLDDSQQAAAVRLTEPYSPRSHVVEWLSRKRTQHAAIRNHLLKMIAAVPSDSPLFSAAGNLLNDIELLAPQSPRKVTSPKDPVGGALEWSITDTIGGVFLKGWIRDPRSLVQHISVLAAGETIGTLKDHWHIWSRPDIDRHFKDTPGTAKGFVAYIPRSQNTLCVAPALELTLASGLTILLTGKTITDDAAKKRTMILGSIPADQMGAESLDRVIAPPVSHLQKHLRQEPPKPVEHTFGTPPQQPWWSIIIPLYRNLDYVRHQLAAFSRDPEIRNAEILYVLDSPEQEGQLKHYLRGLHGVYDIPLRILVMPYNSGYSTANNTAAQLARGDLLVLLNSDIVPAAPGWLGNMTRTLERHRDASAVGARLLFEDQSLQHAGMYFAQDAGGHWLNVHYFKGAPREYPPALLEREVPAITGAAVLLRKKDFDAVGGFSSDYVIGDYEDTDLCLKLRERGGKIFYSPNAVLYHFERKSIMKHAGYTETVAGLYNRRLAAHKWGSNMQALMHQLGGADCRFV